MATLVQFLAAGVKGAESGSATFLLRGTASSAAAFLYNDFERVAQPGTNIITLDANGAAEVYCSVYCDVVLKTSAGVTLRTVTIGNSSGLVEVRSDSFKGDDYDGSPANTESQPITLTNVLNKWNDSAGASDWKVLLNGVATNLSTAFASFAGIFINVKDPQYGAVGDGVTSDTTAITNAIAAAASVGGIVVFPPGTYLCGQIAITAATFCLIGFGQATLHGSSSGGAIFVVQDNTPAAVKVISGLRFTGNGSPARALDIEGANTVFFDGCTFDDTGYSSGSVRLTDNDGRYYFTRCRFDCAGGATSFAILDADGDNKHIAVSDCHFTLASGFNDSVLTGPCFNVDNCTFDGSLITSGVYYMIDPHHPTDTDMVRGNVSNCTFIDGGSSGFVFGLLGLGPDCNFAEDSNTFIGFAEPATLQDPGHIYDYSNSAAYAKTSRISLGSRRGKQLDFTNAAAGGDVLGIQAFLVAEHLVINQTDPVSSIYYMAAGEKPAGLTFNVVVLNNSGVTRDISFSGTSAVVGQTNVVDGGRAMGSLFTYLETTDQVHADVIATAKTSV